MVDEFMPQVVHVFGDVAQGVNLGLGVVFRKEGYQRFSVRVGV